MQKTMKAVVLEGPGAKPVVKEIPIPEPKSGQVLIKVDSAPINPSDIAFLYGSYSSNKKFPTVPGFEGSGTVIQSGGGMMGWKIMGKNVAFYTNNQFGTYGEYCIADATVCLELDADMPMSQYCCSFVNPLTVMCMLEVVKDLKCQAVIHTAAASSLGRMMVRYFQQNGVKVINIIRRDEQIEILKKEGAQIILNQEDQDFFDKLKQVVSATNATVFFDALGNDLTGKILEVMPSHSNCYVYGGLSLKKVSDVSITDLIFRDKKIQGFWLTQYITTKNILSQAWMMKSLKGLLRGALKTTIAKEVLVDQFEEGLEYYKKNMSEGKVQKPILLKDLLNQQNQQQNQVKIAKAQQYYRQCPIPVRYKYTLQLPSLEESFREQERKEIMKTLNLKKQQLQQCYERVNKFSERQEEEIKSVRRNASHFSTQNAAHKLFETLNQSYDGYEKQKDNYNRKLFYCFYNRKKRLGQKQQLISNEFDYYEIQSKQKRTLKVLLESEMQQQKHFKQIVDQIKYKELTPEYLAKLQEIKSNIESGIMVDF